MPYNDKLDADEQISAEEAIASHLFENSASDEMDEETCAKLGRDILHLVLSRFRPDVIAEELPLKTFTVFGVYIHGDKECIGERFGDIVKARSWREAEVVVKHARGSDVMIAATFEGLVTPVDDGTSDGAK